MTIIKRLTHNCFAKEIEKAHAKYARLRSGTLAAMAATFEHTPGTLAQRLLKSLIAGEKAGGQINRNTDAIKLAQKVVKKHPTSSYTWHLLAQTELNTSNKEAATRDNATALKLDPENADAGRLQKQLDPHPQPIRSSSTHSRIPLVRLASDN